MSRIGFKNHARAKLRNLTQFPAELLFHHFNSLERMVFMRSFQIRIMMMSCLRATEVATLAGGNQFWRELRVWFQDNDG
jgi:hypothetical protein